MRSTTPGYRPGYRSNKLSQAAQLVAQFKRPSRRRSSNGPASAVDQMAQSAARFKWPSQRRGQYVLVTAVGSNRSGSVVDLSTVDWTYSVVPTSPQSLTQSNTNLQSGVSPLVPVFAV